MSYSPKPTDVRPIKSPMYRADYNANTGFVTFTRDDNGKITHDEFIRMTKHCGDTTLQYPKFG